MITILQQTEPVLRELAQNVKVGDISSTKIQRVISDMKIAMSTQKDGVAIAAPQIGIPLRIFVVSDAVLAEADDTYRSVGNDLVFINPIIIKLSKKKEMVEEGCLSVRWKYGQVNRSVQATIKGYNEMGQKVERGASGLLAQIFQHETDHLDGILFIDKAQDIRDIPPEDEARK